MSDDKQKKKDKRKAAEALETPAATTTEATNGEKEKDKKKKKHKADTDGESKTEASSSSTTSSGGGDGEGKEEKKVKKERVLGGLSKIANPLAGEKLTKKVLKLVKKAAAAKSLRRGVKEVQKALRKGESGLMILAGNITPIDVITHLPVLCEEKDIPYIYVPYKEHLGEAGGTKRPTSVILVLLKPGSDFKDAYDEAVAEVKKAYPASF